MILIHDHHQHQSRYSHYLGALLRTEGLSAITDVELTQLSALTLAGSDLVVLPRMALTPAQVTTILDTVAAGSSLLCLMPAPQLASALGFHLHHRVVPRGTVAVANHLLPHLPNTITLDLHTPALCWDAPVDADCWGTVGEHPALVHLTHGAGQVLCVSFDLAATVARLRQGDPALVDCHTAGLDGVYRPSELFVHQLDPQRAHVPQADIYTALLALLVHRIAPQPRVWYYPRATQQSTMLMTSDDDWSSVAEFDCLITALAEHHATCTFYLVPQSRVSPADVARWQAMGHDFSVHPALDSDIVVGLDTSVAQPHVVADMLTTNVRRHEHQYATRVHSIRQHAVRWLGYVEAARILADLGVRMDCNYLAVSPYLGYLCGSGRPAPFVAEDGQLIDCWQQPTLWTEECLIHPEYVFSFRWSVSQAVAATDALIADAATLYYTPVAINSHPVSFASYSRPLIEANWRAAQRHHMPIQAVAGWLEWTQHRHAMRLIRHSDGWYLHTPVAVASCAVLVPDTLTPLPTATLVQRWGQNWWAVECHDLDAGLHRIASIAPA